MLLSIIVPVFNEEKNIGILIEKLLKLDFSGTNFNREIIVVNDGSNDRSREIIEKFDKIKIATKLIQNIPKYKNLTIEKKFLNHGLLIMLWPQFSLLHQS